MVCIIVLIFFMKITEKEHREAARMCRETARFQRFLNGRNRSKITASFAGHHTRSELWCQFLLCSYPPLFTLQQITLIQPPWYQAKTQCFQGFQVWYQSRYQALGTKLFVVPATLVPSHKRLFLGISLGTNIQQFLKFCHTWYQARFLGTKPLVPRNWRHEITEVCRKAR